MTSPPGDDLWREGRLLFRREFVLWGKSVGAGLPWLNWLRRGLCPLFDWGSVWAGNWVLAGGEGTGFGLRRLGAEETAFQGDDPRREGRLLFRREFVLRGDRGQTFE